MKVTFCGHARFSRDDDVYRWLEHTVEQLILNGADTFYLGGYGEFDRLAAAVLRELKKTYRHVQIILVLAYIDGKVDTSGYDSMLYPGLAGIPPHSVISKRNEIMVDMSDVIVAYVTHGWGAAAKTLEYAARKKKTICNFPSDGAAVLGN